ncbi:MAG TPA: (d)CMP kinase [Candidatus Babeliales bacterium]|jgi:cytidylate kinase|nr:(d)CMP kinase [Candidatus Babeliales bacterium]
MIITIDGPVASGKSTISRILADRLEYYYICSGLIYRAIAYLLVDRYGYSPETLSSVSAEDLAECINSKRLQYSYDGLSLERIFFDHEDITIYLKDKYIDNITSLISVNKDVRKAVTFLQRAIADNHNVVIDGRDVGSVVFPHAQIKFFVTASVAIRAQRWRKNQEQYNHDIPLDEAVTLITERDERDKNRTIAPLIIPHNAIVIDTSLLTIDQTIEKMMIYITDYSAI